MAEGPSSSWATTYPDLQTMHFWIDKRGAGSLPLPPHGPRSRHRVAASLPSVPQRRRRYSSNRSAPKSSAPGPGPSLGGAGPGPAGAGAGVASRLLPPGSTPAPVISSGSGPAANPASASAPIAVPHVQGPPRRLPGLLLSRAALPRPHLEYIGSTGSGVRGGSHYLAETPPGQSAGLGVGISPGPAVFNRFTCGLWASLLLASVFVAGTKFYLDFQSSGKEALVLSLLLMVFLLMGCIASVCRARVNSQLAAAAAAAAASVLDRESPDMSPGPSAVQSQASLSHSDELRAGGSSFSSPSNEPPPPYHIAMLAADEQPPPAYEKVVN